jgi:hypothetical protein
MLRPRLAGLPLVVESCEYDRLHSALAQEFQRVTTHVRLVGAGADGLGEDVSVHVEDGSSLHETQPALPLEGEWTLAGFCDRLATLRSLAGAAGVGGGAAGRSWRTPRLRGRPRGPGARRGLCHRGVGGWAAADDFGRAAWACRTADRGRSAGPHNEPRS